jgi:hypothetical protein
LLDEFEEIELNEHPGSPGWSTRPIFNKEYIEQEILHYDGQEELSHFGVMTTQNLSIPLPDYSRSAGSPYKSPLKAMTPNARDDQRTTAIDFRSYLNYLPNYFSRSLPLAFNRIIPYTLNLTA